MAKKTRLFNEEAASVPISSMIDIVFLLIIFFIVTASLDKDMQETTMQKQSLKFQYRWRRPN